ncbi:cupin domain-containing protein [Marinithermus hydrothermalis]|uniref:Cupin 2 conserved barrel domain protein n=1 Tax=Marinithermus hydrothermalis (strain DSM 14884 / JCM 11576 / T1) TaxID=869210 RepID=F2NQE8_MARHT|nr:cupin domain-containing protein [Marinithermus hydrothermalis]AEB11675.1 Cupin 2 conserved barrel domain protein [Marinithermus hydrothermalis DSM 14884]
MNPGVIRQAANVEARPVDRGERAFIQVLLGPEDGVPHFVTRKFTILPGGRIPKHKHPTLEHEQYVLSGRMRLGIGDEVHEVGAGQAVYIPADTPHWYENIGAEPVEFLCVIPKTSHYATEWLEDEG